MNADDRSWLLFLSKAFVVAVVVIIRKRKRKREVRNEKGRCCCTLLLYTLARLNQLARNLISRGEQGVIHHSRSMASEQSKVSSGINCFRDPSHASRTISAEPNLCPGSLAYLSASAIKAAAGVKVIDREYRSISKP